MAEWRTTPLRDSYEVSDEGEVRSVDRMITGNGKPYLRKGRVLTPLRHNRGYLQVSLGQGCRVLIHALVMEAFVGPREEGMDINHINGDKTDNRLINLEYCSRSQKMAHAVRIGLMPPPPVRRGTANDHKCKLSEDDVRAIRKWREEGGGIAQIARHYKVGETTVRHIVNRTSWAWLE